MDENLKILLSNFKYHDGKFYRIVWHGKPCVPKLVQTSKNNSGYKSVRISPTCKVGLHVAIWAWANNKWPSGTIDHIDQDKDNNWLYNLRDVSHTTNMRNIRLTTQNTSGHKNVSWNKSRNKWRVDFKVDKKQKNFGFFKSIEEAINVAEQKRLEIYR